MLLEVPNGVVWKVKLLNIIGMKWLNWNEFKEYYSIGCDYLLIFKYIENFQFFVSIFDLSASNIFKTSLSFTFRVARYLLVFKLCTLEM